MCTRWPGGIDACAHAEQFQKHTFTAVVCCSKICQECARRMPHNFAAGLYAEYGKFVACMDLQVMSICNHTWLPNVRDGIFYASIDKFHSNFPRSLLSSNFSMNSPPVFLHNASISSPQSLCWPTIWVISALLKSAQNSENAYTCSACKCRRRGLLGSPTHTSIS